MKKLFVYGTLTYVPLLELILKRKLQVGQVTPATLPDHVIFWGDQRAFASSEKAKNSTVEGLLLAPLSADDIKRLNFYEAGFGYNSQAVHVDTDQGQQPAYIYIPSGSQHQLEAMARGITDWLSEGTELAMLTASESMGYFGLITPSELAARIPAIRRRAASQLRGRTASKPAAFMANYSRKDVLIESSRLVYSDFFAMREFDIRFRQFDGKMSDRLKRASFIGFDVAIVLPYDPVQDCVLLVEQFRLGPYARGAPHPWVLEPVAGHIDANETPQQAARRETIEEAGLEIFELLEIAQTYPSPGASNEYYYIYLGLCNLQGHKSMVRGQGCENEDIHSHILSYDQLMEFVDRGQANNLPLVFAANWLARNRDRLRSSA